MTKLIITALTFILTNSLFAASIELYNEKLLPDDIQVEVVLKKVELAPFLNDYNTFYFGDNDFEMFLSLNGRRLLEFPLDANSNNIPKRVNLSRSFYVDTNELNFAISRRQDSKNLSEHEKTILLDTKAGKLCLLDDSLISPEFISTSYYGCFDLVNEVQKMIANSESDRNIQVEKNTTFPVSNDPAKAKFFKSWFSIKVTQ